MRIFGVVRFSSLACALLWTALACAADDVIIDISQVGDSILFSVPWDSISATVDTIVVEGDTVVVNVVDTVVQPADTIVVTTTDTLVVNDTVVQTVIDTVLVEDTVFQTVLDTVIDPGTGDTTIVLVTDTIIQTVEQIIVVHDTTVVVDTVVQTIFDTIVQVDTIIETRVDTIVQTDTVLQVDTVVTPPPSLDFSAQSIQMMVGQTRVVQVSVTNADGFPVSGGDIVWFSSDDSVVDVDGLGTLFGIGAGNADVFAIADAIGLSGTLPVQVTADTTTEETTEATGTGDILFRSDWSTATGSTDAALRDTSQAIPWGAPVNGNGQESAIVESAAGLGFPAGMANVLHVQAANPNTGGSQARFIRIDNAWSVPANGQSLYYRTYIRMEVPNTVTTGTAHPIQDGFATNATNWELGLRANDNSSTWFLRLNTNATAFPNRAWVVDGLNKGETYRIEWQILRLTSTTFNLHARIYDASGTLLYDDNDFVNLSGDTNLGDVPTLTFRDVNELSGLNYGTNGAFQGNTSTDFPSDYYYGGGLCVSAVDWCGPYAPGR